ncbi:MAG: antibiotic biosynthesis monooxygenase [Myxococcales bacterium]
MPYVVIARWKVHPEDADWAAGKLAELAAASRKEPGCLSYEPHRGTAEPTSFAIVEHYRDEAAFKAHVASEHFGRIAKGEIVPRLLERVVEFFRPLGGPA